MTTRTVHWPADRPYGDETKAEVAAFLRAHPFLPDGPGRWLVNIPEGRYEVIDRGGRYVAVYAPVVGIKTELTSIAHAMHRDDAWARTVLAVLRDAATRPARRVA